jgi:ribosomal protein S18 acetylase RimI-like enzyme
MIREDEWLSERFGRPVFTRDVEAEPEAVTRHAQEHAPALYQAKLSADRVAAVGGLTEVGFKLVDVNLTLSRAPARLDGDDPTGTSIGAARADHRDSLLDLLDRDFQASRFYLDPAVPVELAKRIMRDWLGAYFDGTRGERLIVATEGEQVAGFVAVLATTDGSVVTQAIDVIGVRHEARRSGLGSALVRHALAGSVGACERVDVGTQVSNLSALALYTRMGFVVREARYVLHLHADAAS